jgi:hypothetical protein
MSAETSISIWLRMVKGMVQTHQSAVARSVPAALALGILDRHAARILHDPADARVVGDEVAHLALEGVGDLLHAADGLEHGRVVAVGGVVAEVPPEARAHDVAELDRLRGLGHVVEPAARRTVLGIAAIHGGIEAFGIAILAVEDAEGLERLEQHLPVLLTDELVERALVHGLRQHLGHAAHVVGPDLVIALLLAAEGLGRVEVGVLVLLHEDLELHAEAVAVVDHRAVVVRDAPGTDVDVLPLGELAGLGVAAHLLDRVALLQRPAAAAGAVLVFEDPHLVARAPHLVGGDHAGEAAPRISTFAPSGAPSSCGGPS